MMQQFLSSHYALRVNLLRRQTEYAVINENPQVREPNTQVREPFTNENPQVREPNTQVREPLSEQTGLHYEVLDDMALNTIFFELRKAGIRTTFHELECYLFSRFIPQYHPFRAYMDALPAWDGRDRATSLARRVSHDALWVQVFSTWLRALTAQWIGLPMQTANSMVPVLVSERQGLRKSTFCRMLMPTELQGYYLDKLDFTQAGEYDRMMAQFGLINLDELDRYSPAAMARFKSATQMTDIMGHSTRTAFISRSPRLASFIATTNQLHVLHDATGSRRFYCQMVEQPISCRPINHPQLFAQLRHEVEDGARTWFNKQEEARIQAHNKSFQRLTPLQTAILTHFRRPFDDQELAAPLTARQIFDTLSQRHPRLTLGIRLCDFSKQLTSLFATTPKKHDGLQYYAVPLHPTA